MTTRPIRSSILPLALLVPLGVAASTLDAPAAEAARPSPAEAEKARVERLAGLGRIWGVVKFFHPYLAYKNIDWDAALVSAIPKVNGARTAEEYRDAVNQMLSFLGDPATTATIDRVGPGEGPPPSPAGDPAAAPEAEFVREKDGVVILDLSKAAPAMNDYSRARRTRETIAASLAGAGAVVIDIRPEAEGAVSPDGLDATLRTALAHLAEGSVTLGSPRFRHHFGYVGQGIGRRSGYFSALTTNMPEAIAGRRKSGGRAPAAAVIVGDKEAPREILAGFQAAGLIQVVQEGPGEDPGPGASTMTLPSGVSVRIRTVEIVGPDGAAFRPDVVVPPASNPAEDPALTAAIEAARRPAPRHPVTGGAAPPIGGASGDDPYLDMKFPNPEYRLLALFRLWNVIHYFFPYKHLLDEPWDGVLTRFIPRFEGCTDQIDYQRAVHEASALIGDSHVILSGVREFEESLGRFSAPILLRYVEGRLVVGKVLEGAAGEASGLGVGDVVLEIDGEPAIQRMERLGRYFASSSPRTVWHRVYWLLLGEPTEGKTRLKILPASGTEREVEVERKMPLYEYIRGVNEEFFRKTPPYEILPSGFGYMDLGRLAGPDGNKALDALLKTPAIIMDMRGYPLDFTIPARLTTRKGFAASQFRIPVLDGIHLGDPDFAGGATLLLEQPILPSTGEVYHGKVVVLIDARAMSAAEHLCLFFEAAADVTFIGSATHGANGNVTAMVLPGGISIMFSGLDVRHADGRQLQRLGIQPHVKVEPTIQGIREGRDEVLEAAVKFLQGGGVR